MSVRIYADQINITNVLKLVEFVIINKEKTNSFLTKKSIRVNSRSDDKIYEPIITVGTKDEIIDKIFSTGSEKISSITKEKILIQKQKNYGIEIYWQDDKFIFEYKYIHNDIPKKLFELKDYFYHKYININDLLIFVDKNRFYFLEGTTDKKKELINIKNSSYAPLEIYEFGDKIILYPLWNRSEISVFLKNKNMVISEFE